MERHPRFTLLKLMHRLNIIPIKVSFFEEIDKLTYGNYPTTEYAYLHDIKRSASRASAEPVGTFIIYPGLGTCEVLAHNWIGDGASGGTYTLKVLKTGKVVTYIRIGDTKIRRQGQ